jgi:enoyl-CoA hydratase
VGSLVELERPSEGVGVLTLNRPEKRNALSPGMLEDLANAVDEFSSEPASRALVLTGVGSSFCAGVDISEISAGSVFPHDVPNRIARAAVPVIAAVNGAAFTGGLELALACDFRVAARVARFADTHAKRGLVPEWGMSARLPAAVGQAWARQLSLTGQPIDALTALRIGLVNEVVEDARIRAVEIAVAIAEADAASVRMIRGLYDVASGEAPVQLAEDAVRGARIAWRR